jgi:DNA primase
MATREFVDFKAVKAAVTMVRILDHYGLTNQFKRTANGDTLTGACPIHKGENPTQFRISVSKNCWNCFGRCQRGGNILDFVSRIEDCTIRQAAIRISEWFGLEQSPTAKHEEAAAKNGADHPVPSNDAANQSEAKPATDDSATNKPLGFELTRLKTDHPYLFERGISSDAIAHFGLGFCEHGSMAGRIVIPIRNAEGKVVAYAGRWPGEPPKDTSKYKLPAGFKKSQELFNLDGANDESDEQPLIVVEGFFDCISLWQLGLTRTVALMGSALSAEQETLLREHTTPETRIILMLDEDDAGRAARTEIAERLVQGRFVKVVSLPSEGFQPEALSSADLPELL